MKASELLVKALENEGVKYVFGVPGEENLDFLESLSKSNIRFILTRHEQAAGFMAATIGRLTGKAGVALATLGPGATNLTTAAAYAKLGGMPTVFITGQKPIKNGKQGCFQIVDIVEIMRPVTKFTAQIVSAGKISSLVREAFRVAQEERPGAVHLELPEDVAKEDVENILFAALRPRMPDADEPTTITAAKMIMEARSPIILAGAGANRKRISETLRTLVDATGIPFFNTQMGKGVVDERHALFIGTAALSADDDIHEAVRAADLIINVGHDVIEKPPFIMERTGAKVIHVNSYSAKVDGIYFPQLEVIGDIGNFLRRVSVKIVPQAHWDFEPFLAVKRNLDARLSEEGADERFPLSPQRVVADVRASMPEDGVVTLDNGQYKLFFAKGYKAYGQNTLLLDNALATMGAGLPSAIAAALLFPEKRILAICGDGGFMMNSQELETAVRLGINLSVIVLKDNALGMVRQKQEKKGFADFGLTYGNPDFVKYAESYGANGWKIEKASQLFPLLRYVLSVKGVHLIEVPIDYSV